MQYRLSPMYRPRGIRLCTSGAIVVPLACSSICNAGQKATLSGVSSQHGSVSLLQTFVTHCTSFVCDRVGKKSTG